MFVLLWGLLMVAPVLQLEYDLYGYLLKRRNLYMGDYLHERSGIFGKARLTEWVDSPDPVTGLYYVTPAELAALPHRPALRAPLHPLVTLTTLGLLAYSLAVGLQTGAPHWTPLAAASILVLGTMLWQIRLLRFYRAASAAEPTMDVNLMTGLEFMIHVRRAHYQAQQASERAHLAQEFPPSLRLLHRLSCRVRYWQWDRTVRQWGGSEQVDAVITSRMEALAGIGTYSEMAFVSQVMRDETCRNLFRQRLERTRFEGGDFGRSDLSSPN